MIFNFYSRLESGHRAEYITFSKLKLGGERVRGLQLLSSRKPLLFLMVEENFILYFLVALLRSLFKLKTVGLVFRAKECVVKDTARLKIKFMLFKILKPNKMVTSLSIVPFFVAPELCEICDDWIYDFQFWDVDFLESTVDDNNVGFALSDIRDKAKGRKIVCAIGRQDTSKGFDKFIQLYINSAKLRGEFLFVSGGCVSGVDNVQLRAFEDCGALLWNRRISDSELVALYGAADVVWACYSPEYNQSSGVLGRALQYGKSVIVRRGSLMECLASEWSGSSFASLEMPSCEGAESILLKISSSERGYERGSELCSKSMTVLMDSLAGRNNE